MYFNLSRYSIDILYLWELMAYRRYFYFILESILIRFIYVEHLYSLSNRKTTNLIGVFKLNECIAFKLNVWVYSLLLYTNGQPFNFGKQKELPT